MKISSMIVVAVCVALLVAVALALLRSGELNSRGAAMLDIPALFPAENKKLGEVVIKNYDEYRANAVRWSAAYFGCLFGAAFLSALAALFMKLELLQKWPRLRNDVAAAAAILATLLITLSTTGDFQRKWQANRIAAASMENLAYELINPHSPNEFGAVIAKIQAINEARNRGIVGEQGGGESKSSPQIRATDQPTRTTDVIRR